MCYKGATAANSAPVNRDALTSVDFSSTTNDVNHSKADQTKQCTNSCPGCIQSKLREAAEQFKLSEATHLETIQLLAAKPMQRVTVVDITGEQETREKLADIEILPETELIVLANNKYHPLRVNINGINSFVTLSEARAIIVKLA